MAENPSIGLVVTGVGSSLLILHDNRVITFLVICNAIFTGFYFILSLRMYIPLTDLELLCPAHKIRDWSILVNLSLGKMRDQKKWWNHLAEDILRKHLPESDRSNRDYITLEYGKLEQCAQTHKYIGIDTFVPTKTLVSFSGDHQSAAVGCKAGQKCTHVCDGIKIILYANLCQLAFAFFLTFHQPFFCPLDALLRSRLGVRKVVSSIWL